MINSVTLRADSSRFFDHDPLVLEREIKNKNAKQAVLILTQSPHLANQPLPNGEMPLHYAIRQGNFEFVRDLLAGIAFSDEKDHQGMTCLDHAFLTGNKEIISLVLGHRIGKSFDVAKSKVLSASEVRLIEGLVATTKVLPAHLGDEWVDLNALTSDRKSMLHLAAIAGDAEWIETLTLTKALNVNLADADGFTPLHYAMTHENPKVAQLLIAAGADPLAGNGVTPMDVMVHLAKMRAKDPLKIESSQWLLFATIVAPWISSYFGGPSLVGAAQLISTIQFALVGYQSFQSLTSAAAFIGMSFLNRIPVYGFLSQMCLSTLVAKRAVKGLAACWANLSLELYRPIRNAIVYSVCGMDAAHQIKNGIETLAKEVPKAASKTDQEKKKEFHDSYLAGSKKLREEMARQHEELNKKNLPFREYCAEQDKINARREEYDREYFESAEFKELEESIRKMWGSFKSEMPKGNCESKFEPPNPCDERSCLTDERLDPAKCESHARAIFGLKPGFSKIDLKKAYREMALKFHPDRKVHASAEEHAIMSQISNAYGLLKA